MFMDKNEYGELHKADLKFHSMREKTVIKPLIEKVFPYSVNSN